MGSDVNVHVRESHVPTDTIPRLKYKKENLQLVFLVFSSLLAKLCLRRFLNIS